MLIACFTAFVSQTNLTELKAFPKPPPAVVTVTAAVMVLLANKTKKIPKDRSWNAAKVMMGKVSSFFEYLTSFEL
jgi:dynein heavy chain, axonemal